MIRIMNLNKKFGKKVIYQNFSATFPDKGIVALTGESGSGKTTLLRILAGLDKKYSGKVEVPHGTKISYIFQEPRLLPDSDALENVALPLGNTEEAKELAKTWLTRMGLEADLHTYPDKMSGGMKQRVSIARAFAYGGDILLLDEPFNGIDTERTRSIMDMVKEYAKEHLCIIVTHHEEQISYLRCEEIKTNN